MATTPDPKTADSAELSSLPLGIDLGTTMSAVAVVDRKGQVVTLRDEQGSLLTPSALYFSDDSISIGASALQKMHEPEGYFIDAFKRDIGEAHYHEQVREYWVPPEVFAAFVLKKIAADAAKQVGEIGKVVITVPAYYDERRRQATLNAGRLAGLDVADIINEPTAAALAHYCSSITKEPADGFRFSKSRIMVYDLGGGTFDVSILETEGNNFRTLATDGDVTLGGRDFDDQLVRFLAEEFLARYGVDPRSERQAARQLWQTAQEAKHTLSKNDRAVAACRFAEMRLGVEVTREKFESLISHFLQRTVTTCQEVLKQANLEWKDLQDILLVGGSSRIPAVSRALAEVSGKRPHLVASPDEIVAHGAAIYAATQHSTFLPDLKIINVNSHSLGVAGVNVETQEPVNKIIIRRNTPLPASAQQKFVTRRENQAAVSVNLLEGESENPRYCTRIAECRVELEPDLPERTEVVVTIRYGTDGTISISAVIPLTRQSAHVEVSREGATNVDSLSVWHSRLVKGEEPLKSADQTPASGPPPVADLSSSPPETLVHRADFLMNQLGVQAVSSTVPVNALASQRAVLDAQQEIELVRRLLNTLEIKLKRLKHRLQRISIQEDIAALRNYITHAEKYHRHLTLSLGRECSVGDAGSEESREVFDELQQLRGALSPETS